MNTFRKTAMQRFTDRVLAGICWMVSIVAGICFLVLAIAAVIITIVLGVLFAIIYFLLPIDHSGIWRNFPRNRQ